MNTILNIHEVTELKRLNEKVKETQQELLQKMDVLMQPGREVFFMHGPYLQKGIIISVSSFYWNPTICVRNEKTLKERTISLYDVFNANFSMGGE